MQRLRIVFAFLFFAITFQIQAQDFPFIDVGIKAGANAYFQNNFPSGFERDNFKFGYVGGFFARFKLPLIGLYVQPEAVISQSGGSFKGTDQLLQAGTLNYEGNLTLTTLDFPVLIGQRFGTSFLAFRVNAGPVFSTVLSAKQDLTTTGNLPGTGMVNQKDENQDVKDDINSFLVALQAGVGIDISKINIDLRYQLGFTKLAKNAGTNNEQKTSAIQLTVGFKFL